MFRFLLAAFLLVAVPARAQPLTVFAAASLTDALKDIGKLWKGAGHPAIRFNFAATSTLRNLLGNDLVLVMPKDRVRPVAIGPTLDIAALLGANGRLATGDPANVPAGMYAQQALSRLGLWNKIQSRLARSDSVRSALLLVERGEAPAGIVYATDAAIAPNVAIAGVFPDSTHDPIIYSFAVTTAGDTAEARAFLLFLAGPDAAQVFRARGFRVN
jgi:molybdate transport system substrate-binding protein